VTLQPGTRPGPYEIFAPLGAREMGEVIGAQWELPGAVARRNQGHAHFRTTNRFEKPTLFLKDPRVDGSERGGPGLPGARSRKATVEPARTNCRGVRGLSRAGRANDEDTAGLCAPADEPQFPLRPLQTSAQPFARQTETAAVTAVRPEFHRRIRYRENPISTRTCFADRYAEPPSMGRLISAATGRSCRR
jgi:hypothetical protein